MRIIFVRHGEPDYEHDCLTETGRLEAQATAKRLAAESISAVYCSPNGRAQETASYTAEPRGLPIITLPYMHEISWGGEGIPEHGHPWTLSDRMIEEGFDFSASDWRKHPYFSENLAMEYYDRVSSSFDGLLSTLGFDHEGGRFFCRRENTDTIAVFSHGGSGACVLANLLSLHFPYVCSVMPYGFTAITIVGIPSRPGTFVRPRLILFGDTAHTGGCPEPILQGTPDEQ